MLKALEEKYQECMVESNGVQTEEIKKIGEAIDDEIEFIESETIMKKSFVKKVEENDK